MRAQAKEEGTSRSPTSVEHQITSTGTRQPSYGQDDRVKSERPAPPALPSEWYDNGMHSTIDKAGRLVIPKALRDSLGLVAGEVEVTPDGAGLHIEPLADDRLKDEDGLLVIPADDAVISDDLVRMLRDADQR